MPSPLDSLASLSLNARDPNGLIAARRKKEAALLEMKRSLELQAGDPQHTFSGATQADVADEEASLADSPDFGDAAQKQVAGVQDTNDAMAMYNRPDVTKQRTDEYANKLALVSAPAEVAARGNLAVAKEETSRIPLAKEAQTKATMALLGNSGGGGAMGDMGVGGGGIHQPRLKVSGINPAGEVSFKADEMPDLVRRAHGQLSEANDQTLRALSELERLMPGINAAAQKADSTDTGWLGLLGIGNGPFGGWGDRAHMEKEYLKYQKGEPTPWANMFAEASFGNISQMAGQLPGVRGLATVSPLFKEHQGKFGRGETPVALTQRLRHMVGIMGPSIHRMEDPTFDPTELTFGDTNAR